MGCIITIECYSLVLGECNVKLTNSRKLVVKLSQQTCTWKQWHMPGHPCRHALAMIFIGVRLNKLNDEYDRWILPSNNGR